MPLKDYALEVSGRHRLIGKNVSIISAEGGKIRDGQAVTSCFAWQNNPCVTASTTNETTVMRPAKSVRNLASPPFRPS
jgi:hypothetical protein